MSHVFPLVAVKLPFYIFHSFDNNEIQLKNMLTTKRFMDRKLRKKEFVAFIFSNAAAAAVIYTHFMNHSFDRFSCTDY